MSNTKRDNRVVYQSTLYRNIGQKKNRPTNQRKRDHGNEGAE